MSWLATIFMALLTGVAGLLCAGLVAAAYAQWYSVSTREGAAGFMVVGVALLGGLVGGVLGLILARVLATAGFWGAAGASLGVVAVLAGVLALAFYHFADIAPKLDHDELRLEVEIKLPAGEARPAGESKFTLGSTIANRQRAAQSGELLLDHARLDEGRWVVPARAYLFTTRGQRTIMAEVEGQGIAAFLVPLPARPSSAHEQWSDWGPRPPAGRPPWPESKASYRYRVQRLSDQFRQEEQAGEEAAAQAKFDAIPDHAPITQMLGYTVHGQGEKRRQLALQSMARRPKLVEELGALMRDADARLADAALRAAGQLREPPQDWVLAVHSAGEDIVARLRSFNALPPTDASATQAASDLARRYQGWISAVHEVTPSPELRFLPLLRDLATLSAARSDRPVLPGSVHEDAERWVKIWTASAAQKEGQETQ